MYRVAATLVDEQTKAHVADIHLNGHRAGGPLGISGPLQSFFLVGGECRQVRVYWRQQRPLQLRQGGQRCQVRMAALPTQAEQPGYLEYV